MMSSDLEVTIEPAPPPPPPPRSTVISSGPMSEGIISMSDDRRRRQNNDATEHVCMFSVCLMFIGIPIMVVGILLLSFYTAVGIILLIVGVVASTSGAFMAILSAILSLFTKSNDESTAPQLYNERRTQPEIIIESTNYSESFDNNNEEPEHLQQLSTSYLSPDFPEKLDPVTWSNYPEAQNPKSYLNSFGDLPKVLPSPDVRSIVSSAKGAKKTQRKKSKRKISITKSMRLGGGRKRTMSRTSLTRDNDEIDFDTSSLSSNGSVQRSPHRLVSYKANGVAPHQSVVTIETIGRNMNEERVDAIRSSGDELYDDQNRHTSDTPSEAMANGVLPNDIELHPSDQLTIEDSRGVLDEADFRNYADLWNTIRKENSAK